MAELTLFEIDQISTDVKKEEIVFSHLPEDLIDHICCDVESRMNAGFSFNEAYIRVKQEMGLRRLKEIQQETLFLVDTKYRKMKNTVKISGVAGTIIFGLAALFKIQHWPGSAIMMIIGSLLLSFVFLPSALTILWKETHNKTRLFVFISAFFTGTFLILGTMLKTQHWPMAGFLLAVSVLSGIPFLISTLMSHIKNEKGSGRLVSITGALGMIFIAAGMLFRIQHWPNGGSLMILGMMLLCFMAFPIYVWTTWKNENFIKSRFLFMLIGLLMIIVPMILINLNAQNSAGGKSGTAQTELADKPEAPGIKIPNPVSEK